MSAEVKITDAEQISNYRATILSVFASLKVIRRFDELVSRCIRLEDDRGYLLCISELHADDEELIAMLARWRAEATTFHNKFNVTLEGTKRWLRELLLDIPDRILFLVMSRHGHPIGHMGFANALNDECLMEFDNVVRGVQGQDAGIMSISTKALLDWANKTFLPKAFYLRTLDDNDHAIRFYSKLGFKVDGKQPLRRVEKNGEINHVPLLEGDTDSPDRYFTCMRLDMASVTQVPRP